MILVSNQFKIFENIYIFAVIVLGFQKWKFRMIVIIRDRGSFCTVI